MGQLYACQNCRTVIFGEENPNPNEMEWVCMACGQYDFWIELPFSYNPEFKDRYEHAIGRDVSSFEWDKMTKNHLIEVIMGDREDLAMIDGVPACDKCGGKTYVRDFEYGPECEDCHKEFYNDTNLGKLINDWWKKEINGDRDGEHSVE